MIDLRHNYPVLDSQHEILEQLIISDSKMLNQALDLEEAGGSRADREIAAKWVSTPLFNAPIERVFVGTGGHDGCLVALLALNLTGKAVAVEEFSYASFRLLANALKIRLFTVKMDDEGLIPGDLEQLCQRENIAALYCMASVHNPTSSTLSLERRQEICHLAERHSLMIIEDDAYGFLEDKPLPNFAMLSPERAFYIQSFSKPFAPGLKVAYFIVSEKLAARVASVISMTSSNSSALLTGICNRLIQDGSMTLVIGAKRREGERRQAIARTTLSDLPIRAHPNSWHLWVRLPEKMDADRLVAACEAADLLIDPASKFQPQTAKPFPAIRIGLGGTREEGRMIEGLEILNHTINTLAVPPST